jgi:hypothetical protein
LTSEELKGGAYPPEFRTGVDWLRKRLADEPLYLAWRRQGKLWWNEEWIQANGPVRQRIPGLEDHISFANFDLRQNGDPQIAMTSEGRPFVMCIPLMSEDDLRRVSSLAIAHLLGPAGEFAEYVNDPGVRERINAIMHREVYSRLADVSGTLDVVHYHGFEPASRSIGLDYLDPLLPRKGLRRVEFRKPEP